jgi:hypothetical protein
MIVLNNPGPVAVEQQYGEWTLSKEPPPDFDLMGLPYKVVTLQEVATNPFCVSQIRYWEGDAEECWAFIKGLHSYSPVNPDLGRALFGA